MTTTPRNPELHFLPASPFAMTFPQGRRLIERKRELAAELLAMPGEMAELFHDLHVRATGDEERIAEVATGEEAERIEVVRRRTGEIDDALRAIGDYLTPWLTAMVGLLSESDGALLAAHLQSAER